MLWNVNGFLETLKVQRNCWIGGRAGGGKTSLGLRFAYELISCGVMDRLVTNSKCVFAENHRTLQIENPFETNTVVVLDEAGLFMRDSRDTDDFLQAVRKLNVILILCSVKPPAPATRELQVERIMQLNSFGFPVWRYRWSLESRSGRKTDEGAFAWIAPHEIFGVYDTKHFPVSDLGVGAWLADLKSRIADTDEGVDYRQTAAAGKRRRPIVVDWSALGGEAAPPPDSGVAYAAIEAASMQLAAQELAEMNENMRVSHERKRTKSRWDNFWSGQG